jgi:hypothetical protein
VQELKPIMKEWDTQAYGSPSVDAEAGDRSLRGKGLRLKKISAK